MVSWFEVGDNKEFWDRIKQIPSLPVREVCAPAKVPNWKMRQQELILEDMLTLPEESARNIVDEMLGKNDYKPDARYYIGKGFTYIALKAEEVVRKYLKYGKGTND